MPDEEAQSQSRTAPRPPTDFTPTLPELIRRSVDRFGEQEFVLTAGRRLTLTEIDQASRHLARFLVDQGVGKGTRVGFILPQGPEWIVTFLAAGRIGALAMPLSTFFTPHEARGALRLGDVSHLVLPTKLLGKGMEEFAEATIPGLAEAGPGPHIVPELPFLRHVVTYGASDKPWATVYDADGPGSARVDDAFLDSLASEVTPADLLVTLFTSGTTSGPKAVVHTHGAQIRHVANVVSVRAMKPGDRFFASSPFFWVAGLTFSALPALMCGGSLVCQERFEPRAALDLIEETRPNLYLGWPNTIARLRSDPTFGDRDLTGVPWLPPLDTPPVDPGLRHAGMGMTETCGNHTMADATEADRILPERLRGAFGTKVPYVQHRMVDPTTGEDLPPGTEGEICIRGYSTMVGYYKREREDVFDADGWFHTGDRGYFRDGYFFFTGRANDMIKTAGSNVAPREVESVLAEVPGVKLGLVIGVPDGDRGELVTAAVVPDEGATVDPEAVRQHLRSKLSSYKVPRDPRSIVVLAEADVPFINGAKPDRKAVRQLLCDRLGL